MYWNASRLARRNAPLFALAIAVGGSLAAPGAARAQLASLDPGGDSSSAGVVSGQGATALKRQPRILRMKIELTAKGKTLKDALAALKTERESALAKLATLEADKSTLSAGAPRIAAATNDRQQQMEMMVRMRMQQGGKKPKKAPEPPVAVQSLVTAEWKLAETDPEKLLLESRSLEDKIRAAGLAASDKKGDLSPEDQEAAEEAAASDGSSFAVPSWDDGSRQPKPGEPLFLYVAKISPEEHAKALADAFAKARTDAAALSKAAGAELGPLKSLSGTRSMGGASNEWAAMRYNPFLQQMMQQMGGDENGEPAGAASEAIGPAPQEVTLNVSVVAQFALRTPESASGKSEAKSKK